MIHWKVSAPNDEELAQRAATKRGDDIGKSHG